MPDTDGMEHAIRAASLDGTFTRRQYMTRRLLLDGANFWRAVEAVSSTAIAHPEWDMDEKHTWPEWEAALARGRKRQKEEKSE